MKRIVLHSDLNNFYASVECLLHPELRDKYVAVCGNKKDRHGIVLAKNQRAKLMGVSTGEAIWEAQRKCPELIVVPPTFDEYLKYSNIVRQIYLSIPTRWNPSAWMNAGLMLPGVQHCLAAEGKLQRKSDKQ